MTYQTHRRCPIHDITLTVGEMDAHELVRHAGRNVSVGAESPTAAATVAPEPTTPTAVSAPAGTILLDGHGTEVTVIGWLRSVVKVDHSLGGYVTAPGHHFTFPTPDHVAPTADDAPAGRPDQQVMSNGEIMRDDAYRPTLPDDVHTLIAYLETLRAPAIRELAAHGMPCRHESTKPQMIRWLVRYAPEVVRQHRADSRGVSIAAETPSEPKPINPIGPSPCDVCGSQGHTEANCAQPTYQTALATASVLLAELGDDIAVTTNVTAIDMEVSLHLGHHVADGVDVAAEVGQELSDRLAVKFPESHFARDITRRRYVQADGPHIHYNWSGIVNGHPCRIVVLTKNPNHGRSMDIAAAYDAATEYDAEREAHAVMIEAAHTEALILHNRLGQSCGIDPIDGDQHAVVMLGTDYSGHPITSGTLLMAWQR